MQRVAGRVRPASSNERGPRTAGGFTLIELMVTLAVLAVLVTLAAPSFASLTNRNRLIASANELVAAMQVARMEAVRRNNRVALCPSTDGNTCAGDDWSRLIVFVDADGDNAPDAGADLIREVQAGGSGISIKADASLASNHRMRFGADGFARVGNGGSREGGLSVCSSKLPEDENTRDVTVVVSRVAVTKPPAGGGC